MQPWVGGGGKFILNSFSCQKGKKENLYYIIKKLGQVKVFEHQTFGFE